MEWNKRENTQQKDDWRGEQVRSVNHVESNLLDLESQDCWECQNLLLNLNQYIPTIPAHSPANDNNFFLDLTCFEKHLGVGIGSSW